jgi:serine/threonine protein kinase/tetratricopeptide (TPR) repeat protein
MICPHCQAENPDTTRFCGNCGATLAGASLSPTLHTKTLETPVPIMKPGMVVAGKYRIVEEIGRGGMGIVYKAEDLKLKRSVALKFLPPHLMDSPELKERFLVEAQAAAALNHPDICVIHEVGESEERPYIAMEFVEGETLKDKLRKGPLGASDALAIASQVAAGLAEAHGKGIIHRDIKSANIMVTAKGQAKVMDFGLAKLQGGSSLTKSQTTLGTVAYMSPEQARGEDLDARTDIWSLGVCLYEALAGKLPFRGDHDQAVIHSILHHEPEPLKRARPDAPPGLEEIVGQALAKKPGDRYQTMEELREDIEAVAEGLKPFRAKYRPARKIFGIRAAYVFGAVVIVLAAILGLNIGSLRSKLLGRTAPARTIRLAVLPFENLSGDPEQDHISDGMTQEMIAQLGRLHPETLSVIARTSVMQYQKTKTPIDQIGRELNVGYVLEGSAQKEGTRIRITADLIKVQDQSQIWSESIEREMSDILALQNEVAQKVAGALALKLIPAEQARLASTRTVNPEAYEACLKGDHAPTPDASMSYYELALEKDPNCARAYAGISLVWFARSQWGGAPPGEAGPKAKAAARRALELDETLPGAHVALALILGWTDWDWAASGREWERAIELSPEDTEWRAWYSHYLLIVGRPDEAMRNIERAVELDPMAPGRRVFYSSVLWYARRIDDCIEQARRSLQLAPVNPMAQAFLVCAFHEKGQYDEAIKAQIEYYKYVMPDKPDVREALERGYAEEGFAGAFRRAADVEVSRHVDEPNIAWEAANNYMFAGDTAKALDWLEKYVALRGPNAVYIHIDPFWDPVRSDPRFQALLRKMNFPVDEKR